MLPQEVEQKESRAQASAVAARSGIHFLQGDLSAAAAAAKIALQADPGNVQALLNKA